jgi:osmoprotectant transport system permease protein
VSAPRLAAALALALLASVCLAQPAGVVRVGSKNFTEQEILGEIVAQLIERTTDLRVERRFGLGGTDICHAALEAGQIDAYVEYTGTALLSILKRDVIASSDDAYRVVASEYRDRFGLEWLPPIGFNNTYAMSVREADAEASGWLTMSDLAADAGSLTGGFPSEFMERPDGYPGMREVYGLDLAGVREMDIGLMYTALDQEQVDLICAFATDGRLEEYDLRVLADDRGFFPPYDAAPVFTAKILARHPAIRDALVSIAGTIPDEAMRRLNYEVDVLKRPVPEVARRWIDARLGVAPASAPPADADPADRPGLIDLAIARRGALLDKTLEHLWLTLLGAGIAMAIGVPLGVLVHRRAAARGPVLTFTEIMQTIPSLALLAFLFAVYGVLGQRPAVTALVLYALLPIVLNTFTGLREIPAQIIQAADGVGMSARQRLLRVELPLAAPIIIAGIRTATVLTVGIATLSTYIGAGGLGDFIARGLARNDTRLTLLGAIPAALLAVALSLVIRLIERALRRA